MKRLANKIEPADWRDISAKNPATFVQKILGTKLWDKQIEIADAVRDYKYVIVQSCYGAGKSNIAARLALWYLYTFVPSKIITTATSWNQVEKILWSEIGDAYKNSKVPLGGRLLTTELKCEDDWFATGISPLINVESEATRFEGFHSPNVMVIIDQAQGIKRQLWDVAKALITNENCRMLVLGNPTSPTGPYYEACRDAWIWHKIHIPASCTPNVKEGREIIPGLITQTWIDDRAQDWGLEHPLYISKVLAEFPEETQDVVILLSWVDSAIDADLSDKGPRGIGVDIARFGDDYTVLTCVKGQRVVEIQAYRGQDTMKTAGHTVRMMERHSVPAHAVCVDDTGVGGGVTDRLHEEGHKVRPTNNGDKAADSEHYFNLSAEMHWEVRRRFEHGLLSIPDNQLLIAQLPNRKYEIRSNGQIKLESKDDMKKRGLKSPDHADSLVLAVHAQKYYDKVDEGPAITVIG